MVADNNNANGTEAGTPADGGKDNAKADEKRFTQAEVDEIINKRLAKEKATREREESEKEAERKKQAEIDRLDGEEKLKAQYQMSLDKERSARSDAERKLRIANTGVSLSKLGYDSAFAEILARDNDEDTDAMVTKFDKMVKELVKSEVLKTQSHGAPPIPDGGSHSARDDILEKSRIASGLAPRK